MAKARKGRLNVWPDETGVWWWNMAASNGKVFITSNKGYSSKRNALVAAATLLNTLREVKFDPVDENGDKLVMV